MVYILIGIGFWVLSAVIRKVAAICNTIEAQNRSKRLEEANKAYRQEQERRRQEAEQQRQAAAIARIEKRMVALENSIERSEYTINTQTERVAELDAQLDRLLLLQAGTVPGGNEHSKLEEKISAKKNQIRSAEERIMKAKQAIRMAKTEMEAA